MSLPWLKSSLVKESSDWDFHSTVTSAMDAVSKQGAALMQPVTEQVRSVVQQAMPEPAPAPPMQVPEIPTFSLGTLEDWGMGMPEAPERPPEASAGLEVGREGQGATSQAAPTGAVTPSSGTFSLGSAADWLSPITPTVSAAAQSAGSAFSGRPTAANQASPSRAGAVPGPSDVNEYLKVAALKAGVDPSQVLAVMGKEGPTGWGSVGTFDTGTSYGPLQLHYAGGSNPKEGMGDRFTKATGIDLRKDSSLQAHQAAVDFAMQELVKRGDFSEWYGADNAFPASQGGKGRFTPVNRVPAASASSPDTGPVPTAGRPTGQPKWGTYAAETLSPNQVTEGTAQGLTMEEALAVCGPAAAVAFARSTDRAPTLKEAKELAAASGVWDASVGMHGPASEVALLDKMGVPARLDEGADWNAIRAEVQAGRPVIVDTPNHYFTVTDAYDDGSFEFGQSAGVLKKSGGRTRYRPEQIPGLGMGAPRASIFMR